MDNQFKEYQEENENVENVNPDENHTMDTSKIKISQKSKPMMGAKSKPSIGANKKF
jgi:hypothetical protein